MHRIRVIPCLLVKDGGLVKTIRFKRTTYVGDPINAVKIFNEKEVDELVLLDLDATAKNKDPDLKFIREIATECFMPLAYGGGIRTVQQIKEILSCGVEKVVINTAAYTQPGLIREAAELFGSQAIVLSMDFGKNIFGKLQVYVRNGTQNTKMDPVEYAKAMVAEGAGEIFLNSIDRDGTYAGFDIEMIKRISESVDVPVIACGGAKNVLNMREAIVKGKASAVAAGSLFVFKGPHRAVLINFPSQEELKRDLYSLK